jgi:hypothetical protein
MTAAERGLCTLPCRRARAPVLPAAVQPLRSGLSLVRVPLGAASSDETRAPPACGLAAALDGARLPWPCLTDTARRAVPRPRLQKSNRWTSWGRGARPRARQDFPDGPRAPNLGSVCSRSEYPMLAEAEKAARADDDVVGKRNSQQLPRALKPARHVPIFG